MAILLSLCLCASVAPLWAALSVAEAERLAASAVARAATDPEFALVDARRALRLTTDFIPTQFVKAGRRGEIVEDAYLEARLDYRRHRARLYAAVGECLARLGRHAEAVRYLRRSAELDRSGGALPLLARSLVALGRGHEALDAVLSGEAETLGPVALAAGEAAADALRLPSLQAEIDRARIEALEVEPRVESRHGPFRFPEKTRLSTGERLTWGAGATLLYVADTACRTCSADLQVLKRMVPAANRVVMVPEDPDEDRALRKTLELYGYDWPVLVGRGNAAALGVAAPAAVVVARQGWSAALLRPPLVMTLPLVLEVFGRSDLRETLPRKEWNQRPVERKPAAPRPGLLPEGLAPAEEEPAPDEFAAAVQAFRDKRPAEALRLFDAVAGREDGRLLPPEARYNRALCLAAQGQREAARLLLLRIGDSRFQEAVDQALERVGTPRRRPR